MLQCLMDRLSASESPVPLYFILHTTTAVTFHVNAFKERLSEKCATLSCTVTHSSLYNSETFHLTLNCGHSIQDETPLPLDAGK